MLDLLNRITTPGESMTVTYSRADDASVRLVIQPALDGDPESLTDDDARTARAALCRPLLFRGSHADVTDALTRYVTDNTDTRINLRDAYDTLTAETKTAASKAVQAAADKKAKTKATAGKNKAHTATDAPKQTTPNTGAAPAQPPATPVPQASESDINPSSLF